MNYDIVIENGRVINPKSMKCTICNVGIIDGKIVALTREKLEGKTVIDATSKVVCPGFIDIHAHVEGNLSCAKLLASMGVTTVYNGNCGMGVPNLAEFIDKYEREGFLINQVEQVGHTTLRELVGLKDRYIPASEIEIRNMALLLEESFKLGGYGLSFGLEYVPGASKEEVIALSKIAAKYDKLISIHTRGDGYEGLISLREAIDICKITGARVQISHLVYQFGMGMISQAIKMIDDALDEGFDISVDSGMYSAFATAIGSAVFDEGCVEKWGCDYSKLIAATGQYRGQRLTRQLYTKLRDEMPEETVIGMVGKESDVYEALRKPYMMVSTDAGTLYDGDTPGHPQDVGTFPRFIRTMVREQGEIPLIEAIRRCTYLPASRLGLSNKGFIGIGADADILIFEPDIIADKADYPGIGQVDAKCEGINYVIVNGKIVVEGSKVLEEKPGNIIRGESRVFSW